MVTLFHGEDYVSSRTSFASLKDASSLTFDAESPSVEILQQSFSGVALFSEIHKVFIENLFSSKAKNQSLVIDLVNLYSKERDIYLWDDGKVAEKLRSEIKNLKIQEFNVPKNIWTFLDGIRPSNKSLVNLYHKVLEESDENVIFSMLIRQFRLMLSVTHAINTIDESKRIAPWQKNKLLAQARNFSEESLRSAYTKLYKIDKKHKTGSLDFPLSKSIDFFLAGL